MSALSRDVRELRDRTSEAFARLGLPEGTTLSRLLESVAEFIGRRIEVDPVGGREWETVTGLVVVSETEARVLVRKSDPRWYQFHSVLHELSHLVLRHEGCRTLTPKMRVATPVTGGQTILARSTTRFDFELDVDFSDDAAVQEAEAEKLSQMLAMAMLAPKHRADEAALG